MHTPGPWTIHSVPDGYAIGEVGSLRFHAMVFRWDPNGIEDEANARLYVLAPRLLALAEHIHHMTSDTDSACGAEARAILAAYRTGRE